MFVVLWRRHSNQLQQSLKRCTTKLINCNYRGCVRRVTLSHSVNPSNGASVILFADRGAAHDYLLETMNY